MNINLAFYWRLLLRRLPVMTALFLVCVVVSGITAIKLPPTFSTSAKLLLEEPQIPDSMIRSIVQTDADEQLQVIEQQLLTRANMIDIARKYNVFSNGGVMLPDEIVTAMRSNTRIRRSGGRDQATLMDLSFEARSGRIAADVVNEYVTLILQQNTNFRMGRTESALNFFVQEVERLSLDLDLQSARIVEFKSANSDALPDDLVYRQGRQTILQERLARLEREIAGTQRQRDDIVAIFEETGRLGAAVGVPLTREEQQLQDLEFELEQALSVYSETNPRVILLRSRIAQLTARIQEHSPDSDAEADDTATGATAFDLTLAELDQRLTILEEERAAVTEELSRLEASLLKTSSTAISLNALERDYENIQVRYNEAVRNRDQARMNERIEVTAQGQRISVIEGASVPQVPSGPNRIMIVAAGIAVGLGLAVGFFLLLELINRTIRRPFELKSKYGITPLAVIPYMESSRERLIRRTVMVSAFLIVLLGVPGVLYYIDLNYMPLDILANKVFDRLGLT